MPAQSPDAAAPGTPFASLLGQADATAVDRPTVGTETGSAPVQPTPTEPGANMPSLYPAIYYMPQMGTAQMQSQLFEIGTDIQPQDISKSDQSRTEEVVVADVSIVLAYEFVAGQWIPQPSTPPLSDQPATGETAGRQLDAGLSVSAKTGHQNGPANQSQLTDHNQPVIQNQPTGQNHLVVQNQPVNRNQLINQSQPADQNQPVIQNQPMVSNRLAVQNQPVNRNQLTNQSQPVDQNQPVIQKQPIVQNRLVVENQPIAQDAFGLDPAPAKAGTVVAPQPVFLSPERERVSAKVPDFRNTVPIAPFTTTPIKTASLPEQTQNLATTLSVDQIATANSETAPSLVSMPIPRSEKAESTPQFLPEKATPSTPTETSANGGGTQNSNQQFAQGRPALLPTQEKFAAPSVTARSETASGVNSSTDIKEKKSLFVNGKEVTTGTKKVGTGTANREIAMSYFATNKSPSVDLSTIVADGIQQKTTTEIRTDTQLSAQAPRLVQEIRTIADRISSIDRNSVEVRFDFSDTERLSVRVEYRDGTVHTTFKTDSSQLRDVVAHEWQAQNASAEQRSYRMADPVFTQTASDRQNFAGGDTQSRQRAFEQQAQLGVPSSTPVFGRSAELTTSAISPPARSARPETSLHLHALA